MPNPYFCKHLSEAQENFEMSQGLTVIISISGFKLKISVLTLQKKHLSMPYPSGHRDALIKYKVQENQ